MPSHIGRLRVAPITPSDLTFDYVQFTAKSMGALCVASVEFMQDAPNAGELIQASIAKAMARKLDIQGLYGGLSAADPAGLHLDSADEPNAGIITEVTAHAAGNLLGAAAADGTALLRPPRLTSCWTSSTPRVSRMKPAMCWFPT